MIRSLRPIVPVVCLILWLITASMPGFAENVPTSETRSSNGAPFDPSAKSDDEQLQARQSQQKVHALTHVSSVGALRSQILDQKKLATQRARCDAELESLAVPVSCFWVLKKEKNLRLIRATSEIRNAEWLERLCVSRSEKSHDLTALVQRQHQEDVPSKCQTAIDSRAADLRYQYETTAPRKLFQEHYQSESSHDD